MTEYTQRTPRRCVTGCLRGEYAATVLRVRMGQDTFPRPVFVFLSRLGPSLSFQVPSRWLGSTCVRQSTGRLLGNKRRKIEWNGEMQFEWMYLWKVVTLLVDASSVFLCYQICFREACGHFVYSVSRGGWSGLVFLYYFLLFGSTRGPSFPHSAYNIVLILECLTINCNCKFVQLTAKRGRNRRHKKLGFSFCLDLCSIFTLPLPLPSISERTTICNGKWCKD